MIAIPTLADGGTLYMIFNDHLCGQYALPAYPSGFTIDDFDIEASGKTVLRTVRYPLQSAALSAAGQKRLVAYALKRNIRQSL